MGMMCGESAMWGWYVRGGCYVGMMCGEGAMWGWCVR